MSDRRNLEASLAEMDRKLRELQRELALVAGHGGPASPEMPPGPPATATPPTWGEPAPPTASAAGAGLASAADPVAGVVEEAAARVSELGRRIDELARLRDDLDRATQALRAEYRAARERPASREVVLDAGPFPDVATVGAFEQAVAGLDGVEDAVVRAFAGHRATVDVRVRGDADLEAALRRLPFPAQVTAAQGNALTLHLRSSA